MSDSQTDSHFDVAVVGGGPAGIAAALSAASCGARVVLIEKDAVLGGNVSQALVHTICGLFFSSADKQPVHAHPGLPRAFAEAMRAEGSAGQVDWAGTSGFLPIQPEGLAELASRGLHQAQVDCLTDFSLREILWPTAAGEACQLRLGCGKGTHRSITAWTVVDASGDAAAATAGSAETAMAAADLLQHASYIFRIDGIDAASMGAMECARTTTAIARAAKSGIIPRRAESALLRLSASGSSLFVTLNLPKPDGLDFNPLDAAMLSRFHDESASDAASLAQFLFAEREALRGARLGAMPTRVGIRETRRVVGMEQLKMSDVLAGRRREDEVCLSTWPIELWESHKRLVFRATEGPCSIPQGCLVSNHPAGRLAMAGRCASASHEALGAIRVIGTSMAMGEAAGVAAALAARAGSDLRCISAADVRATIASGTTTSCF